MNAGFIALVIYALNGIRLAKKRNALPVIVYGEQDIPYFYEPAKGPCVWDYYFEPISPVSHDLLIQWQKEGRVTPDQVHVNTYGEAIAGHQWDEDRLATFWAWEEPKDKIAWMANKRALGRKFLKAHLNINADIQEIANDFADQHFHAPHLIGVHIRGTDFQYAEPISIERYFEAIDQWVREGQYTDFQVFVATDQQQFIQQFEDRYPNRIVCSEALRSFNHIAPFKKEGVSAYQKGADVLIDILLLSKCHYILKGAAAVGEFALWLTPEGLPLKDFAIESEFKSVKYYELKSAYLKLNVSNKSKLGLLTQGVGEFIIKCFMCFPPTRTLFNRYKWARRLLKH